MSKEYEIKTKMEQEQLLQLKMLFLLGYWVITWKLLFRAGGMTFGGEGVGGGGGGGGNFSGGGVGFSPPPPEGKPCNYAIILPTFDHT